MFTSSICKHINKWGSNKGNICGKSSRKKDSSATNIDTGILNF